MVQLVCHCMNIRVHVKSDLGHLIDANNLNLPDAVLCDNFFSSKLHDVVLDLGGITKAQKNLCTIRNVDSWVITSCIGCDFDVYAKHPDNNDRVLVSSSIEKDPTRISTLMESENYSSLFKLILPEINENFAKNNFGSEILRSNKCFENEYKNVQLQVTNFLKEEQKAMEERIRNFSEQQQSRYAALQQTVRKHKHAMAFLLMKMKDCPVGVGSDNSTFDGFSPSMPLTPPHNSSDDSCSSTDFNQIPNKTQEVTMEVLEQNPGTTAARAHLRRLHSVNNPPRVRSKSQKVTRTYATIDVDDVFNMDGFDTSDHSAPFDQTDDDSDEGSSAEYNIPKRYNSDKPLFAGSLPMNVPTWTAYSRYSVHDDDDDEEEEQILHRDPEQLAASFRALRQSVRDGTEMFGDLPHRRLNTGDLIKCRPS